MSVATDEAVDTRAADAAWLAMDVLCAFSECGSPAMWLVGHGGSACATPICALHKRRSREAHEALLLRAPEARFYCVLCSAEFGLADAWWRPL